jgi:hypothetical protein
LRGGEGPAAGIAFWLRHLDDYFDEVINCTARYFCGMAALYGESARRKHDPHAADPMSAIAARHQGRADELEQW